MTSCCCNINRRGLDYVSATGTPIPEPESDGSTSSSSSNKGAIAGGVVGGVVGVAIIFALSCLLEIKAGRTPATQAPMTAFLRDYGDNGSGSFKNVQINEFELKVTAVASYHIKFSTWR